MERIINIENYFLSPALFQEEDFQNKVLTDGKFLHKLRLRLKEIRVLCDLLEFGFPSIFLSGSLYECYREFYRKSGRLRDINVQIILFSDLCKRYKLSPSVFPEFLFSKKEQILEEFKAQLKTSYTELPNNIQVDFVGGELEGIREKLMVSKIKTILDNREDLFVFEKLHWLRKQIKKIIYLDKMKLGRRPVLKKRLVERLHQIEIRLGSWHDLTVLRKYLLEYETVAGHAVEVGWFPSIMDAAKVEEVNVLKSVVEVKL
jgi:CHAD domain-containing protein